MKKLVVFALSILLSGCAYQSMYAKFENDGPLLQGSVTNGSQFKIRNIDDFSCSGQYPFLIVDPTVMIAITCSDGRSGNILLTLNEPDFTKGWGQGELSDGTKFKVFVGNVKESLSPPSLLK
jgi:hypothetical protein